MSQSLVAPGTGPGQESATNPASDPKSCDTVTEIAVIPTPKAEGEAIKKPKNQIPQLEGNLKADDDSTAAPVVSSGGAGLKESASENGTRISTTPTKKCDDETAELILNEAEKLEPRSNENVQVEPDVKEDEEGESSNDERPKRKSKVPQVRKVNFEGFKNRFSENEEEYAIDVLVAGNDLMDEIRREQQTRQNHQSRQERLLEQKGNRSRKMLDKTSQGLIPKAATQPKEGGWIQRVRIRSQAILYHLAKVAGESWDTNNSRTFNRPFCVFIYFHEKMKEVLVELESRWAEEERRLEAIGGEAKLVAEAESGGVRAADDKGSGDLDDEQSTEVMAEGLEALREIRCYVRFMEGEIIPLAKRFEGTERTKVRFDDLWFLFKVGDMICAPEALAAAVPGSKSSSTYQPFWRVYTINPPTDSFKYPAWEPKSKPRLLQQDDSDEEDEDGGSKGQFKVWAYYIDHDGTSYGAVKHNFPIVRYSGEREVTKLPCYPLRYLEDREPYLDKLKALGKKFEACMDNTQLSYCGWTLISTPVGAPMRTNSGIFRQQLHAEYIDSHVVVDFAEAFHQVGDWKPTFHRPKIYDDGWESEDDDFPVITWSDEQRSDLVEETIIDTVQVLDGVTMWQRKDGLSKDSFLKASSKLSLKSEDNSPIILEDEDYALLPRRMFAYVLKDRKFVCIDVQYLNEIPPQDSVFKNLKIDKEYKQMVKGLVQSHLAKKELERKHPGASKVHQSQDIISGKGRGLVILLHGVPGVGKTATAEAVALEYGSPLFVITCGDLGLTPKEVEASLTEIFRLAHLWHCILLFDEADVFLAQRSRFDLTRNALVSVFLRILEYYNGILFLTTNRVGTLDEAFKSRIHMSLYYPPLNRVQVELIFKMNLDKLISIEEERQRLTGEPKLDIRVSSIIDFAIRHCTRTETEAGRWNGRQIRNAFQIASSLARYHALEEYENELAKGQDLGPRSPVLDDTQFKKVERATEAFKDYLEKTKGFNDADLAHILGERDDLYRQGKLFGAMAGAGAAAGAAAAGYAGPSPQAPRNLYPSGQYSQGIPPEHGGGRDAPDIEFPTMAPGPMAYGHNESPHPPATSHAGGRNDFQTPPYPRAGRNTGSIHTPSTSASQGYAGVDPFINEGHQQSYGRDANPGHHYNNGGHRPTYDYQANQSPLQSRPHIALDEDNYN